MLYSAEKGNASSFRGKVWQLPNKYWRACNHKGQQCTYKLYNEAIRFAVKGKINEEVQEGGPGSGPQGGAEEKAYKAWRTAAEQPDTDDRKLRRLKSKYNREKTKKYESLGEETVYDDEHRTGKYISDGLKRQQTRYRPELSRSEMDKLVANLKKQGYKATAKGPNLKTDATDKVIDMAEGVVNEGPRQPGHRVSGKAPKSMPDRSAFDIIKPGSRVSMRTPQGQVVRGKAVMYNRQHDSWVLNMGGRHGTPGVVTRDNFVGVGGGGGKMNRLSDRPRREVAETNRINEAGPSNLVGGKRVTSTRDLTYSRAGVTIPKGTTVELKFSKSNPGTAYFQYEGQWRATRLEVAYNNWRGIPKPPSMRQLQKMEDDGVSKTVTGQRIEPDAHGSDGAPSWSLVMGLI